MSEKYCENIICSSTADYVFTDDFGTETYVCEGCGEDLHDVMLRPIKTEGEQP